MRYVNYFIIGINSAVFVNSTLNHMGLVAIVSGMGIIIGVIALNTRSNIRK